MLPLLPLAVSACVALAVWASDSAEPESPDDFEDRVGPYAVKPGRAPLQLGPGLPIGSAMTCETTLRGARITADAGVIDVSFLTGELVRILITPTNSTEPDHSWAVIKTDRQPVAVTVLETESAWLLSATGVSVQIAKVDCVVNVSNEEGTALLDSARVDWHGPKSRLQWAQPADRRIFGLGEKSGGLERRGKPLVMWNTDHYAFEADADPLYQSIPFCIALDGPSAHGLFLDNTFRTVWDLGERGTTRAAIQTDDGVLDLYVFAAGHPKAVLSQFTELTGRMELPPLWALGYQQSKYSYYPEIGVRDVAAGFRSRKIPCDVIYFDIHYMDAYKDFTWDRKRFPNPAKLLSDLKADGFQSVVILDPAIKVEAGYTSYDELKAAGFYVRNPDGSPFVGEVWPGDCLYPDFTDAACRAWWGRQFQSLVVDGVSGFWNDMNEPAVFEAEAHTMPPNVRFAGDGVAGDHLRYHNVYGQLMAQGTYEGVRALRPNERAFVLSRAAYAGAQRYAATWTGDNVSSWDHLWLSLPMVMSLGLSGQGFSGPDVGGFVGDPSPELFGRWLQACSLFPFCRVHSSGAEYGSADTETGSAPQEPWSFGPEWEAINRASIELRYQLLPYLYTVFEEMTRTGLPVMRPLLLEYPEDPRAVDVNDQFLIGRDLLVAPVVEEGKASRSVYLPRGRWYNYWTSEAVEGGRDIQVDAPVDRMPIFVRAGAIVPTQETIQHTGESTGRPLVFRAYLENGSAEGEVYEDDGISMDFQKDGFRRTRVTARTANGRVVFDHSVEGSHQSPRPAASFRVVN